MRSKYVRLIAGAVVVSTLIFALPAGAQVTWDADPVTSGPQDGSGVWSTSGADANWWNGSADVAWPNLTTSSATFGAGSGTAGTVTVNSTVTANGITFDSPGSGTYTLTGGTISLAGTTPTITANVSGSIGSVLTGSVGLTKAGSGVLELTGSNTYSGATTISAGTLQLGNAAALPSATALTVNSTGALDMNGFNATVASLAAGASTAKITNSAVGTSTLTISTFNTQVSTLIEDGGTGKQVALVMEGGQFVPSFANANNTFSGGLTISSSASLTRLWNSTVTTTLNGDGSIQSSNLGTGTVTIGTTTGNAQFALTAANTNVYNPFVFNAAGYADGGFAAFRTDRTGQVLHGQLTANLSPVSFSSGGTGSVTALGQITGTNGLRLRAGNITLTLSNTSASLNNYQGATTVETSTVLSLGASDQLPNGASAGSVALTGTLRFNGVSDTINGLSGVGTVDGVSGTSALSIGDNNTTSTFSGAIVNSGVGAVMGITKIGSGTLTLSGSNTYSGATTISDGTLKAGSTTALSVNSGVSVAAGATLDLGGFNNTIKSLSTATGTITDSSGAGSGGILKIATAMPASLSSQSFTGSMGLQFFGGSTANTILSNTANTYSGGTILGNGSGNTGTRLLLGGGTLGAGSPGAVTSGIFGTGAITIGAATTDRSQLYFSGGLTINNAIVVNSTLGDGTQFGAFRVESTGSILAGTINANLADAMFEANNATGQTIRVTGAISGAAGLQVLTQNAGGLTVTLDNAGTANSYAGNTTISGNGNASLTLGRANQIANGAGKGDLIVTAGKFNMNGFNETINGLSGSGTVDGISGTPTLTVGDNDANGVANTFAGVIKNTAGSLGLTKIGSGTLTLSGSNTYSGLTDIVAGTLAVNGSVAGAVNVGNGATLSGTGVFNGLVVVAAGGVISPGNSPGTLSMGSGLTLAANSILNFELSGTDFTAGSGINDLIVETGNFTLDGLLNVVAIGGGDFTSVPDGTLWQLFNYSGGSFNDNGLSLNSLPSLGAGRYYQIDTSTSGRVDLVVVPEPGANPLLGIGVAVAAWAAKRSRRRAS
jgi:fibronectin-binding autotransporter adhesin